MAFYISFLSTRPVVKVTPQLVTSRSPWLTHLLTLGFYSRTVVIDSRTNSENTHSLSVGPVEASHDRI